MENNKMKIVAFLMLLAASAVVLPGCPVPQPQNTPVQQKYMYDPVSRRGFWMYLPSTYTENRSWPVIVTCHGTPPWDVAEHHIREWKMLGEENGCIVVAPDLEGTDGIIGDGPLQGMQGDERYILSILSLLGYKYNIDRANIMITGFSGGGFPTYWVGLRHPEIFSVVAARNCNFNQPNLDGWYPPEAIKQKIIVYYGQFDPGTIRDQSQNAISYLQSRGFNIETYEVPGAGHDRHPEVAMDFFRRNWRTANPSFTAGRSAPAAVSPTIRPKSNLPPSGNTGSTGSPGYSR